jgi:hypothetical protein
MPNLAIVFVCLTTLAAPTQEPDWLGDLAKAEALWKSGRARSYEMTVEVVCPGLCVPVPAIAPVFQVSEGRPRQVRGGVIDPRSQPSYDHYNTVERLFEVIRQVATTKPYRLAVQYDTKLGYPVSMSWDMRETISDDQLTIRVTGFKIVAGELAAQPNKRLQPAASAVSSR